MRSVLRGLVALLAIVLSPLSSGSGFHEGYDDEYDGIHDYFEDVRIGDVCYRSACGGSRRDACAANESFRCHADGLGACGADCGCYYERACADWENPDDADWLPNEWLTY